MSSNNSNAAVSATVAHIVDNSPTSVIDVGATLTQAAIGPSVRKPITMSQVSVAKDGYDAGWNEVLACAHEHGLKAGKGDAKKALLARIRATTSEEVKALFAQRK